MKQDTWFLLLVGLIGMFHNVLVAGLARESEAHGIPLKPDDSPILARRSEENRSPLRSDDSHIPHYVDDKHVMDALKQAEALSAGVGLALVPLLFPAGLSTEQEEWSGTAKETMDAKMEEEEQAEADRINLPQTQGTGRAPDPAVDDIVQGPDGSRPEEQVPAKNEGLPVLETEIPISR
jgi:hypothetical protein